MSSIAKVSTSSDVSSLFDKFAKICPENDKIHFLGLRTILEGPEKTIQNPWEIYLPYNNAMKIARNLANSENPKLKDRFIKILNAFNNKIVHRESASDIFFDFKHIIDVIQQPKMGLSCKSETVNSQDKLKVKEAAKALDLLNQEGIGSSPGIPFFTTRLKSPNAWCFIARNEQDSIIASVLGTNLQIPENSSTVFHFNILVRSPKYPLINFTHIVQDSVMDLTNRFKPDFLTLCVDADNPVKKSYEDCGFVPVSVEYNQTLKRDAVFMVKCVNADKQELPLYINVRAALTLFRQTEQE